MKFILTFSWKPDTKARDEGIARFLKSGGQPPPGVKLLGRWTRVDCSGGFVLLETDNPQALTEFALMWNDLMELATVPVLEDQPLAEAFKKIPKECKDPRLEKEKTGFSC